MEELEKHIKRLMPEPEKHFRMWVRGNRIARRVNTKGTNMGTGKFISIIALTRAAIKFLPQSDSTRIKLEKLCKAALENDNKTDFPWGTSSEDKLTGPYIAGRVLCDLEEVVENLANKDLIKKTLISVRKWLGSQGSRSDLINLPFIYRAARALRKHSQLKPQMSAKVGNYAQSIVDYCISRHCLGSRSQFDPMFLCLAIVIDAEFSVNPLSRAERNRCLEIVSEEYEPLVSSSRSTITRPGGVGCSAIEVLVLLIKSRLLFGVVESQKKQIAATVAWLEDHSALIDSPGGGQVRLFKTDLCPTYLTYEAWFNALVLEFFEEAQQFVDEDRQKQLQTRYLASKPTVDIKYNKIICGGYKWPSLLHDRFLTKVKVLGTTTEDTGNGIVLFGPPGTGKTTIAEIIAKELTDWQFLKLSTKDFLAEGYDNLFKTIGRIFYDLKRLRKCVVFFDELELLVLDREADSTDWATGVLTNIMLPELQELHDCSKLIPIFATNYVSKCDKAGRRPGRFDYVLPVGPPSKSERRELIEDKLPPRLIFDGIEDIPKGGTINEIRDWAQKYKVKDEKGSSNATEIWEEGFKLLRIEKNEIERFEKDIEMFTYPFGIL